VEEVSHLILAGDIGGTNTRLALFDPAEGRLEPEFIRVYPSREYQGLTQIIHEFLKDISEPPLYVCLGVACPIRGGRCEATNLPWVIDTERISEELDLAMVEIINDLEANAYGISVLEPEDFARLNEGDACSKGNQALVAAGTGFGVVGIARAEKHHLLIPSEGGHTDFAPRNPLEVDLLSYLMERYAHVSFERVISGPGLYNIYQFLRDTGRGEEQDWLAEFISREDPPIVISRTALQGKSELCKRSLDLFVSIYGAKAGNVALDFMATGGLFVGGGIAPKIIRKLEEPTFMNAFLSKGRMESLLKTIPVHVILNDETALLGAANLAMQRLHDR
jgi:glucokinase